MVLPLTQDRLFKMGRPCRDSLVGRLAKDSSSMNFGEVSLLSVYETSGTEREERSYSIRFIVSDGREFTYHNEYTSNLGILPKEN